MYRSIQQYPNAVQQKGMVIMRVDAPIYFANVQHIRSRLETFVENARLEPMLCPIKFVILDLSPVPFIDATGAILVFETQKQYVVEVLPMKLADCRIRLCCNGMYTLAVCRVDR